MRAMEDCVRKSSQARKQGKVCDKDLVQLLHLVVMCLVVMCSQLNSVCIV